MNMKRITTYFENVFAAVAYAESGEFETANQFFDEVHITGCEYTRPQTNKIESLQPLRANK
jgi:hypothetical protein